jgi:RHS repeat-associated protein
MSGQTVNNAYVPLPGGESSMWDAPGGHHVEHRDWRGSVVLRTGLTARSKDYDRAFAPFGEMYDNFGSSAMLNFTGDTQDLWAGLFDTPNRELAPTQGRWISPDPAGSGWNRYAYAPNPNGQVDLSGLAYMDIGGNIVNSNSPYQLLSTSGELVGFYGSNGFLYLIPANEYDPSLNGNLTGSPMATQPPPLCFCVNDFISGAMAGLGGPAGQSALSGILDTTPKTQPTWEPCPDCVAGCGGDLIPCSLSQAPYPAYGAGVTSLQYTIWDGNGNVVTNVTKVNEYFSNMVSVGPPPQEGTWEEDGSPLNYSNVANGQLVDNLSGHYTATQSWSAMVDGINYVISTQGRMFVLPVLGGSTTLTNAYNPNP